MWSDYFKKCFEIVVSAEGGYVNNLLDKGGETKYGISKKSYPDLNIKDLTLDQAKEIYKRDYWGKSGARHMEWPLCLVQFDFAVNSGVKTAIRKLQLVLNTESDGHFGPRTLQKLSESDQEKVAEKMMIARKNHYLRIVVSEPSQLEFLAGWLNRLKKINQEMKG